MSDSPANRDFNTAKYWEDRYRAGGTSGAGSYGYLARYKAYFLNRFVHANRIYSVAELGCGDGEQLRRATYPRYTGYDISQAAVDLCASKFAHDQSKLFHTLADVTCFEVADLSLSLDVVYHLIEDSIFEDYIACLFRIATRFVIIYGNGCVKPYGATHVRLRDFQGVIRRMKPDWMLVDAERNPWYSEKGTDPNRTWSNFYVYQAPRLAWCPALKICNSERPLQQAGDVVSTEQIQQSVFVSLPSGLRVLAFEPSDANFMLKVLASRPGSSAMVVGEAPASLQQAAASLEGKIQFCEFPSIGAGIRPSPDQGYSLVMLSIESLARLRLQDFRIIQNHLEAGCLILADQSSDAARDKLTRLVAGGYIREVVPNLLGLDVGIDPRCWIGCALVDPQIVVSLTTIKSRIGQVAQVIRTIICQTRQASRIVLNISAEPYLKDEGISPDDLPEDLIHLERSGLLDLRWVENIGPYRKLLPTLEREWDSNVVIVTADDDTLYPPHWLDELYVKFQLRRAVIAFRCSKMFVQNGNILPYSEWVKPHSSLEIKDEFIDLFTFPTGKDGILYHPSFFTRDVFDKELIRLAPTTDDLTFKLSTMCTRTPVFGVSRRLSGVGTSAEFPTVDTREARDGLWQTNFAQNDINMSRLVEYLGSKGRFYLKDFLS